MTDDQETQETIDELAGLPQPDEEGPVATDSLSTDGDNPNEMDDAQFDLLCRRMRQNGWLGGPIITDTDGLICDGEHRWRAAKEIGLDEVPVRKYDITDSTRRLWRQELNKIHGEHDERKDALEYDKLLSDGYVDPVEEIAEIHDDDLEGLLDDLAEEDAVDPDDYENDETSPADPANDPDDEWDDNGPAEYENEDKTPDYSVKVNFDTLDDLEAFAELVGTTVTESTQSIYYPPKEDETFVDKRTANDPDGDETDSEA